MENDYCVFIVNYVYAYVQEQC